MNHKQGRILKRQTDEWSTVQAYADTLVTGNETAKRIAASRLVLNGLLEHDDILLLNSQLVEKDPDRQIEILELWFTWVENCEKYQAANDAGNGYAVNNLILDYLLMHRNEARKEVEGI